MTGEETSTAAVAADATYEPRRRNTYVYLAILVLITIAGLISIAQDPAFFDVVFVAGLAYFWYFVAFRMAYAIEVSGDTVVFKALGPNRVTTLAAIRSVATQSGNWLIVRYGKGERIDLMGSVAGLQDFVGRVKAANKKVVLKGV